MAFLYTDFHAAHNIWVKVLNTEFHPTRSKNVEIWVEIFYHLNYSFTVKAPIFAMLILP